MEKTFKVWPPSLSEQQLDRLKTHAIDYGMSSSLLMKAKPVQNFTAMHAPFALFPSPYPKDAYEKALQLQPLFNKLVHVVSRDFDFMDSIFTELSQYDSFTGSLFDIWLKTRNNQEKITLGIHRSDYMLHYEDHDDTLNLKQVEINTIAASFASLSTKTSDLHQYLALRNVYCNESDPETLDITSTAFPKNDACKNIAHGIYEAWKLFGAFQSYVLFVVQPDERNIYDQRLIEYELFEMHKVPVIRKTLAEIAETGSINSNDQLSIGNLEISVIYFRAGYGPLDYPSQKEWDARLLMEKSSAVKCPSISYQLVGAKKVQQVLAMKNMVEKFLPENEAKLIRSCFAGIYPIDDSNLSREIQSKAMSNPSAFVLKPQREGGGNNFYGTEVAKQLKEMPDLALKGHILMDRINPPPYKNTLVREGILLTADVICELGIYGVWISSENGIEMNTVAGHLLRTKSKDTNEGGVAAGFAVIDSPLLF